MAPKKKMRKQLRESLQKGQSAGGKRKLYWEAAADGEVAPVIHLLAWIEYCRLHKVDFYSTVTYFLSHATGTEFTTKQIEMKLSNLMSVWGSGRPSKEIVTRGVRASLGKSKVNRLDAVDAEVHRLEAHPPTTYIRAQLERLEEDPLNQAGQQHLVKKPRSREKRGALGPAGDDEKEDVEGECRGEKQPTVHPSPKKRKLAEDVAKTNGNEESPALSPAMRLIARTDQTGGRSIAVAVDSEEKGDDEEAGGVGEEDGTGAHVNGDDNHEGDIDGDGDLLAPRDRPFFLQPADAQEICLLKAEIDRIRRDDLNHRRAALKQRSELADARNQLSVLRKIVREAEGSDGTNPIQLHLRYEADATLLHKELEKVKDQRKAINQLGDGTFGLTKCEIIGHLLELNSKIADAITGDCKCDKLVEALQEVLDPSGADAHLPELAKLQTWLGSLSITTEMARRLAVDDLLRALIIAAIQDLAPSVCLFEELGLDSLALKHHRAQAAILLGDDVAKTLDRLSQLACLTDHVFVKDVLPRLANEVAEQIENCLLGRREVPNAAHEIPILVDEKDVPDARELDYAEIGLQLTPLTQKDFDEPGALANAIRDPIASAFELHAKIALSSKRYKLHFFPAGADFNDSDMAIDGADEDAAHSARRAASTPNPHTNVPAGRIKLCLFPALYSERPAGSLGGVQISYGERTPRPGHPDHLRWDLEKKAIILLDDPAEAGRAAGI